MNKFQNLSRRMLPVILVLLLVGLLFGCSGSKSFVGKYVNRDNPAEYLELKHDDTFYLEVRGIGLTGTYEVEGTTIILEFNMGLTDRGTIDDNTLVDLGLPREEGKTWVKKEG